MTKQWLRSSLYLLLAGLLVAGCASPQPEPTEPAVDPVETPDTTPAPEPPPEPPAFNAKGNPYVPGTTRLLNRTFYFDYDRAVITPDDLAALIEAEGNSRAQNWLRETGIAERLAVA